MKKIVLALVLCLIVPIVQVGAFSWFGDGTDKILTNKQKDVIGKDITDSVDPLRDGTEIVAKWVGDADNNDKIYYQEITTTKDAWQGTANYAKALINYGLGIIGLVALLYLLYHGFLTATAAGDEDKSKKWREWMRYAALALFGIGLAWFIISIVFWLLQKVT